MFSNWASILINLENCYAPTFYNHSKEYINSEGKSMGYFSKDIKLSSFDYKFMDSKLTADPEKSLLKRGVVGRTFTGTTYSIPNGRYNPGSIGGVGNSTNVKSGIVAVLAVETVNQSLRILTDYLVGNDAKLINEHHKILLEKVLPAITEALNSKEVVYIPQKLRDDFSLGLIANVVLFGGDSNNDVYTKEIVDAGMKIYNELTDEGRKIKNFEIKDEREEAVTVKDKTEVKKTKPKL